MTKTTVTKQDMLDNAGEAPSELVKSVIMQFGGWASFKECALDVCRGGIGGGFRGFTYTKDTNSFTRRNHKYIAAMASSQAKEFGVGVFEMIRSFGMFLNDADKPTDEEIGTALYAGHNLKDGADILNCLAWYAGEEVCRIYERLTEE